MENDGLGGRIGCSVQLPTDDGGTPWHIGDEYRVKSERRGEIAYRVASMELTENGWLIDSDLRPDQIERTESKPMKACKLEIEPFDMGTEQDKARKVVEEAAEAFSAWESLRLWDSVDGEDVLYECMDCIQACVNLMASLGATQEAVDAAYARVHAENDERGRY